MKVLVFIGAPGVGKGTYAKMIHRAMQPYWQHLSVGDLFRQEIMKLKDKECDNNFATIREYMRQGKLIPDHLVVDYMRPKIKHAIEETFLLWKRDGKTENITKFISSSTCAGVILDGFPRRLEQAFALSKLTEELSYDYHIELKAVNITLNREITIQKLLGRRTCPDCSQSYNVAHITDSDYPGYDMPAILPTKESCKLCTEKFVKREDDDEDIIRNRMKQYDEEVAPILNFYSQRNQLAEFDIKKGVKDIDLIWQTINK